MTDPNEENLRRALDDVLTVCWTDDIPILDAITESIEDWNALASAEFNDSQPFDVAAQPTRLATAVATLERASTTDDGLGGETTSALRSALADWLLEFGRE